MRAQLKKIRGFVTKLSEPKVKRENRRPPANLDDLVQATQDMLDMRNCYDSLLSAAAATTHSAYEFSEALDDMGTCLLEKTALNAEEDSGRVLLMLGKVQIELRDLADSYRAHVIQTITTPSESLLKELQIVEDMKSHCDDKRHTYKSMLAAQKEREKSRHCKGEKISLQQLLQANDEYEEKANQFIFRLKSLKQNQSRSLLTQAARHHAAQLSFFRKGVKFLESVEPHLGRVADQEHIDYKFTESEDEDTEDKESYGFDSYDDDDGELSFDYGDNNHVKHVKFDIENNPKPQASQLEPSKEQISKGYDASVEINNILSKSAPLFSQKMINPSTKNSYTYVLPTPIGKSRQSSPVHPNNLLKKSENNDFSSFETKKSKLEAASAPLSSSHWSNKTSSHHKKVNFSSTIVSSPNISELHELPRPPITSSLIGHSAPLVYRGSEQQKTAKTKPSKPIMASPLPIPSAAVNRSFSIPSMSRRMPMLCAAKILEGSNSSYMVEEVCSPPMTSVILTSARVF